MRVNLQCRHDRFQVHVLIHARSVGDHTRIVPPITLNVPLGAHQVEVFVTGRAQHHLIGLNVLSACITCNLEHESVARILERQTARRSSPNGRLVGFLEEDERSVSLPMRFVVLGCLEHTDCH